MESKLDISPQLCIMKIWKAYFPLGGGVPTLHACYADFSVTPGREVFMKNRLEEIRKSRGIRQEELASALEVSRQTIGSLENGRYNPSILLALKIARYFDMKIEDIFIYEEDLP